MSGAHHSLALMQPYFYPYIGYFSLIEAVDAWVVFDEAQFIKGGWINRNRLLKPGGGWQYMTVPLRRFAHEARIREVEVADDGRWQRKLLASLQAYRKAPHYAAVMKLLEGSLEGGSGGISDLNIRCMKAACDRLEIAFQPKILSALGLDLSQAHGPGDWGRIVCRQLGADTYINPIGGRELFDPAEYAADGVSIRFLQMGPVAYGQGQQPFEPWLSILDVLMFNSPEEARTLLRQRRILSPDELDQPFQ